MSPVTPPEDGAHLWTTLTRLETKLDLVIGQHDAKLSDHEIRIRQIEATPTVSPKGLTAAIASTVTILVAILTLLDKLTAN